MSRPNLPLRQRILRIDLFAVAFGIMMVASMQPVGLVEASEAIFVPIAIVAAVAVPAPLLDVA